LGPGSLFPESEAKRIVLDRQAALELWIQMTLTPLLFAIPLCEYYAVVKNEFDRSLCDVRNRQELPLAGHG
jgi:hypothetical protein